MKTVNPFKTLSFAAVLAFSVSVSATPELSDESETAGLPSAEELSLMGASKGILLTHQSCERDRAPDDEPKDQTSNGDEKKV